MRLLEVRVGPVRTLADADGEWTTAFLKYTVPRGAWAGSTGLRGDAQADTVHHGGEDKAVLAYPAEHYPAWERELGDPLPRGSFGENLVVEGLDERTACIGDVVAIGGVRLVVTQPRPPCWKLARIHGLPDLPRRVVETVRGGFYLRVLEPGWLEPGVIEVVERPAPELAVARASRALYASGADWDRDAALEVAASPHVARPLRIALARRLAASGVVATG